MGPSYVAPDDMIYDNTATFGARLGLFMQYETQAGAEINDLLNSTGLVTPLFGRVFQFSTALTQDRSLVFEYLLPQVTAEFSAERHKALFTGIIAETKVFATHQLSYADQEALYFRME